MSSEQCIIESRIDRNLNRLPLRNPNERITALGDAIQNDLVPELPPPGGYEKNVTAMDVFSCYSFAYSTSNQDAQTVAKVITNIMPKHDYLTTTLISDKGTAFKSHVNKEVAGVLGITLKHATTKHTQTISMRERAQELSRQSIKHWRIMEASEDHFGLNTSALRPLIITLLIKHALAVSRAECFMDAFLIMSQI